MLESLLELVVLSRSKFIPEFLLSQRLKVSTTFQWTTISLRRFTKLPRSIYPSIFFHAVFHGGRSISARFIVRCLAYLRELGTSSLVRPIRINLKVRSTTFTLLKLATAKLGPSSNICLNIVGQVTEYLRIVYSCNPVS